MDPAQAPALQDLPALADLARYPLFSQVKVLEVIVEPDAKVFLPLGRWHQVTSLDVSLSFSYSEPRGAQPLQRREPRHPRLVSCDTPRRAFGPRRLASTACGYRICTTTLPLARPWAR